MPYSPMDAVLGGRYSLGEVLGTGRTATVYEATELVLGGVATDGPPETSPRRLAAKVLHAHTAHDPAVRAAFVREARAGARVRHAGLVTVLDVGEEDIAGEPVVWMIMLQAPGIPLGEAVRSQTLSLTTALVITSRVLDALAAVHDAGLVHRDISPGNVIVELTDSVTSSEHVSTVTVLDLGLADTHGLSVARSFPGTTDPHDAGALRLVIGTPEFMSPEQARGLPVDASGDLYSVGALLYLMLTGHAPFERSDPAAVLRAQVQAPVPVPSARADVPAAVDRLVSQAMAKSPGRRFASAAEMRAAVERALAEGNPSSNTGTRVLPALEGPFARTVLVAVPTFEGVDPPTKALVLPAAARSAPAMPRPSKEEPRPPVQASRPPVPVPPAPLEAPGPPVTTASAPVAAPRPPATSASASVAAPRHRLRMDVVLVVACLLVICGLVGLGYVATQHAPTADAMPLVSPTAVTRSPPASASASATALPVPTASASPTLIPAPTADPTPSIPQPSVSAATEPITTPAPLAQVDIPWIVSLGIDQARTQLEAVGLVLGDVDRQDSAEPSGTVLAEDPPPGQPVLPGSVVRLTVASGRNLVPPVVGLTDAQATLKVRDAGLVPVLVAAADPDSLSGYVIGVSPEPATSVPLGSVVNVVVSGGRSPSQPPTSMPPDVGPPP